MASRSPIAQQGRALLRRSMSEVEASLALEQEVAAKEPVQPKALAKKGSFLSFFVPGSGGKAKKKEHGNHRRATLSSVLQQSIDSGAVSMRKIVECPADCKDFNEWVAANMLDFFNSVCLFWSLVSEEAKETYNRPGLGFPKNIEYSPVELSRQSIRGAAGAHVSGPEYVSIVLDWIEAQFDDPRIFPTTAKDHFPKDFLQHYAREIAIRIFRVYAIIYTCCLDSIKRHDALAHMNTSFKHFFFFCAAENKLIDRAEFSAIRSLCNRLQEDFDDAKE